MLSCFASHFSLPTRPLSYSPQTPPYGTSFISEFREVTKAEVDCIEVDLSLLKKEFGL